MTNEMSKRFDEKIKDYIVKTQVGQYDENGVNIGFLSAEEIVKSFIQSEIDLAVAEERKRIVEAIEERQDLFNFVPEINGYKYIKAKDLDILSLINKTQ